MKTVILAGLAKATRDMANVYAAAEPQAEVWTLNKGIIDGVVKRCDRFFEMHTFEMFTDDNYDPAYRDWLLVNKMNCPVYMVEQRNEIPGSEEYPLGAVLKNIFNDKIFRWDSIDDRVQSNPYMTSTFSYMLGLAIYEEFDRIYLPGYDMKTKTEYAYQKAGAEFLMGVAMGRGIQIILPTESAVMKSKLYGYEGSQMISRQRLEHWKRLYELQLTNATGEVNRLIGLHEANLQKAQDNGSISEDEIQASGQAINEKLHEAQRISGAVSNLEKLIAECDLQEPQDELPERLARVMVEN